MAGQHAILGAGRPHADDFLRTQVGGICRPSLSSNPGRSAPREEIGAGSHVLPESLSDTEDENEVDQEDGIVDIAQLDGAHAVKPPVARFAWSPFESTCSSDPDIITWCFGDRLYQGPEILHGSVELHVVGRAQDQSAITAHGAQTRSNLRLDFVRGAKR